MIKRTMGRSLLTLLVITGLAGTINNNSLSTKDKKKAISLMKETRDDAFRSTKDLSEAQLNFKAAPEKWSVKECMYHIASAEKLLWGMFETSMKEPDNPEKRSEIKVTDDQLVKMIEDRTVKAQAPEPIQPKNTGYSSLNEANEDFKKTRLEHIKYIKNSTEDLRNHVVQLPFGWIDCYQLFLMIGSHTNRHTQQINEIKTNPGFPVK
ncbi:MAG: DinB family protein [Chitinophagaceae bacterium]|nr:DinB family protein [Chitinophagaceae bacterium]MBK9570924.1 DinB family protein [Chitinophagaceae bacterium]MBL0271943.1 DinB family protein [Chitinophagaceae bacterium]